MAHLGRRSQVLVGAAAIVLVAGAAMATGGDPIDAPADVAVQARRIVASTAPVVSGPLSAPHPTIENLSVVWQTVGDPNNNSTVTVRFRELGSAIWRPAMPLRRVEAWSNEGFSWSARHTGSIFGLKPNTTYEIEATFTDPDGPDDRRIISATTRQVPRAMPNAPHLPATPATLDAVLASAVPGDVIEMAAGTYDGFTIGHSGEPAKPIVVRGQPGTVVNGEIGIFNQAYVHVEDLTVNGRIRFNGTDHVAITGNTINTTTEFGGHGIITYLAAEDGYIADNTVVGLTSWAETSLGVAGDNLGEGILVTGPGHVIEYNRVTGMRDGISLLEDQEAVDQFSIDILHNDIGVAADDGVEADFCQHDCRIMDNRISNTFIGLSSQPGLGGPTYFMRNVLYNIAYIPFKPYRGSRGDVLLHNTAVKGGDAFSSFPGPDVADLYMRNNLFIGGPGNTYNGFDAGPGRVFQFADLFTDSADIDYDGFGSTTGGFDGQFGPSISFSSLAMMRASTPERHAVQVGLDVFAQAVAIPTAAMTTYAPPDLRLAPGSAAVDAGTALPNIDDDAVGAPDLGAYELGSPPPHYGPR